MSNLTNPYRRACGHVIFDAQVAPVKAAAIALPQALFSGAKRIVGPDFKASVALVSDPTVQVAEGMNCFCTEEEYEEQIYAPLEMDPDLRPFYHVQQTRSIARPDMQTYSEWLLTFTPPLQITEVP